MTLAEDRTFGTTLRRLRQAAGLTQEELAFRSGLSPNAISSLERGVRRRPYPHTVRSIADALGVDDTQRAALLRQAARGVDPDPSPLPQPALPRPPASVLGRGQDIRTIIDLLNTAAGRVVTLTGPGGVGKTTLALAVANELDDGESEDVVFVDLAPVSDTGRLLSTLMETLGIREQSGIPALDQLAHVIAPRRMLLVLDNLEHLLPAAPEIASLVRTCPLARLLVTSRAPLRIRGEHEYRVEPLALPVQNGAAPVETVREAPAGELFVERARQASSAFALTTANAPAIVEICQRLGGLPLAIELAATHSRALGPPEILARLDRMLDSTGPRDLPERHQTIRATIDWSHQLLSPAARILYRRLAVFPAGFTLEAAEIVGSDGEGEQDHVTNVLEELVEHSLITMQAGHDGAARYRMLEPIRRHALDMLTGSGEEPDVRERHAAYFAELATDGRGGLRQPELVERIDLLSREYDNIRSALAWLHEHDDPERIAAIGWSLIVFWSVRGHAAEGRRWMKQALSSRAPVSLTSRARALWVSSGLAFVQGEIEQALTYLDKAIAIAGESGDDELSVHALLLRGMASLAEGQPDVAGGYLDEAMANVERCGYVWMLPYLFDGQAQLALVAGDSERASHLLQRSEQSARAIGNPFALSVPLISQAMLARLAGEHERAGRVLREVIAISAELGDSWTILLGATGIIGVLLEQDEAHRAARLSGAVSALRERVGVAVAWQAWRAFHDQDLARLRDRLGDRFQSEFDRGRKMTLEELVAQALEPPARD